MDRPLRKDALNHRRALLRAAAEVMAEHGLNAPLELVAERAGVGRGTLYRNFANRVELALAVLAQDLENLAERTARQGEAADVFFWFLDELGELSLRNAGIAGALRATAPDALAPLRAVVVRASGPALARAQAAGLVRPDLSPTDIGLVAGLLSAAAAGEESGRAERSRRARDLVLSGLRARP